MQVTRYCTRYNAMTINSIMSFTNIKGGLRGECKDVYFIRCVGCNSSYLKDIQYMDEQLTKREQSGQGKYVRAAELAKRMDPDDISFYSGIFEQWVNSGRKEIFFKSSRENSLLSEILPEMIRKIEQVFDINTPNVSDSIRKNFLIKILFWSDHCAGKLFTGWDGSRADKFVYTGEVKKQEYLFCYFLTLLGIDVLILQPFGEGALGSGLCKLSGCVTLGEKQQAAIPPYDPSLYRKKEVPKASAMRREGGNTAGASGSGHKVDIRRPDRERKKKTVPIPAIQSGGPEEGRRELRFEELALLASSIVMITMHTPQGETTGSGSGIMIGRKGYILTNHHVASRGMYYTVRMEDDEKLYRTDEMIKYNSVLDLAVLRIDRELNPLPLYKGEKPLARGQKVVAIGSPLGLFNSVSDGIISGFRTIENVDMIQFTAPISPGSSGGALLNMYGEVIGISTAGYDNGQNINLAVDYKCIANFTRGFL